MIESTEFAYPEAFWLLILIPIIGLWHLLMRKQAHPYIVVPQMQENQTKNGFSFNPNYLLLILQMLGFALLIVAVASPRTSDVSKLTFDGEGIEIVLAIDVSASMLAKDLKPDRLQATKKVASEFVQNRPQDKIGLVLYAGESYTKVPLTTDQRLTLQGIQEINYGGIEDGTAIGMGLATAVSRLRKGSSKSRVIILMSDGENNRGQIEPLAAAEIAKELGIRVYTIGVGTLGNAPTPIGIDPYGNLVFRNMPVSIDENLLKSIAKNTGGQYFRATNNKSLEQIYAEIDTLERTKMTEIKFTSYTELHLNYLLLALGIFVFEYLLRLTLFKNLLA